MEQTEVCEESYFIRSFHLLRSEERRYSETLLGNGERSSVVEDWISRCELGEFGTGGEGGRNDGGGTEEREGGTEEREGGKRGREGRKSKKDKQRYIIVHLYSLKLIQHIMCCSNVQLEGARLGFKYLFFSAYFILCY